MQLKMLMRTIKAAITAIAVAATGATQAATYGDDRDDTLRDVGFLATSSTKLVFPDKTLADLEGCQFYGLMGGKNIGKVGYSYSGLITTTTEMMEFDLLFQDGDDLKCVHVQLSDGEGGVHAKATSACYGSGYSAKTGTWTIKTGFTVATGANVAAYGIRALGYTRVLTKTPRLFIPDKTLAEVVNQYAKGTCTFGARTAGNALRNSMGLRYTIANFGTDGEKAWCEAQVLDDGYLKCAIVEFADSVDGVTVRVGDSAYYKSGAKADDVGVFKFIDEYGKAVSGVTATDSAEDFFGDGYGVWALNASTDKLYVMADDPNASFDREADGRKYTYIAGDPGVKAFPNTQLKDLVGCAFYGMIDGINLANGNVSAPNCFSSYTHPWPSAEDPTKIVLEMTGYIPSYTRYVIVELYQNGEDVWAKALKTYFYNTSGSDQTAKKIITVNVDGTLSYSTTGLYTKNQDNISTTDHNGNYGIKLLKASRFVSTDWTLGFPNTTVAGIYGGEFSAKAGGDNIDNQFADYTICNLTETAFDEEGKPTAVRLEAQFVDVGSKTYTKCCVINLKDGEDGDGVYVKLGWGDQNKALYMSGAHLGERMVKEDGTLASGVSQSATVDSFLGGGYGLFGLRVLVSGEYLSMVRKATWTGEGGDGLFANPLNWECRNINGEVVPSDIPDAEVDVTLATMTLGADFDLTAVKSATIPVGAKIDLNGHTLSVVTLAGSGAGEITDTTGDGVLRFDVPKDVSAANSDVALTGKLRVVKDGEGTLVFSKKNQTFTGGIDISAGTLKPGQPVINMTMGKQNEAVITVEKGATLDIGGYNSWGYVKKIVLNGGTLRGTTGSSTSMSGGGFNPVKLTIAADSAFVVDGNFFFSPSSVVASSDDLTLNVDIATATYLYYCAKTIPVSKLNVRSGGWFTPSAAGGAKTIDATNTELILKAAACIPCPISVRDYTAQYNDYSLKGSSKLAVFGTFTPAVDYFYGCTMQDGSTIDLSAKTGAWFTTTAKKSSADAKGTVEFEPGATVTIQLGTRTVARDEKIITWSAKPDKSVKFIPVFGEVPVSKDYRLVAEDDGLYYRRVPGTVIYAR